MKPHEIAKLVNDLRSVCFKYVHTQQLRAHIGKTVTDALGTATPLDLSVPDHETTEGYKYFRLETITKMLESNNIPYKE